jgi:hypothetical protein
LITADQIDFGPDAATPVISDALKFVIPVPAFEGGGEPLVPPDADGPFLNWAGKPITGRGVVFFNPDDRSWQAARGDGQAVVILNMVTPRDGERLAARVAEFAADPNELTLGQFKAVLGFARDDLGLIAIYDSTRDAIARSMSKADPDLGIAAYGLFRRNRADLCEAVFVPGAGAFQGPAATPQQFDDGAVIVRHGSSVRLVQRAAFEATYKHVDGRPLRASELAVQSP